MKPAPFLNPYLGESQLKRLQTMVPARDYDYITSLRLRTATHTTVTNLLFSKLCAALRARGIESQVQVEQFEEFVANCQIVYNETNNEKSRRSTRKSDKSRDVGDVGPATEGACPKVE